MDNIRNKAVIATRWTGLYRYLSVIINFSGGIYLARMIGPEIFGRVGFSIAVIAFATMASMWGFLQGLMKQSGRVKDNLEYIGTLLTIDVIISSVTLIILIIIALCFPKTLGFLLIILALSKAPLLFTEMHRASLYKDMVYHIWFIIHIVSMCLSMFLACFLAYKGFGLWALVAKYAVNNVSVGILSVILTPFKIRFRFNKEMAKNFFNFGKYAFISSTLAGGYDNIDRISIGSFIGKASLGFYERAMNISAYIDRMFWSAFSPVFISLFGNLKDERARLSKVYNLGSSFFLRANLAFFIWLGVLIPELIVILYGEKWLPAASYFRLLLPFFVLSCLRELNQMLQLSTGHSKVNAKIRVIELISFGVFLFLFLSHFQAKGIIMALNMSALVGISLYLFYARRIVNINFKGIFLIPIAISTVTICSFYGLQNVLNLKHNIYIYTMVFSPFILGMYVLLSVLLEYHLVKNIIQLVRVKKNE